MPAKQFIDLLEAQGLLSPDIVEELRRQVEESKSRITPATLARLLVENGHLTKFQATKLVSELSTKETPEQSKPTEKQSQPAVQVKPTTPLSLEDDLGLAPLEGVVDKPTSQSNTGKAEQSSPPVSAPKGVETPVEVVEIIDDDVAEVVEVVEEVVEVPKKRVTKVSRTASESPNLGSLKAPITQLPKSKTNSRSNSGAKSGSNPWESHRILTMSAVLALLLVAASALAWHFMRGNAETMLKLAEEAYKPGGYENAINKYESFLKSFPTHEQASLARVRVGLARLRKDIDGLPDPSDSLKTAGSVLPSLAKEPALADERGDLAGALVMLAQKFNQRADAAPETAKKKTLMASLDQLNGMLNDPQYVGNNTRQQNAVALARVEEDRQRILRDINRDEDLQAALVKMQEQLKEKNTTEAYKIRRELTNRFPQLEKDPGIVGLVREATQIQRELVVSANPELKTQSSAPVSEDVRTIALANRSGKPAPSMAGRMLCVRAKGTVYGIDGQSGDVKWRYYVGRDLTEDPLMLSDDPTSDAVLCRPELGQLTRLEGATGKVKWFSELGGAAFSPTVDGEDLLSGMRDGTLLNVDPNNGGLKWAVRLPQAIELTPVVDQDRPNIYLPGDHSNLYVLSRQDGSCKEVFYLGHRPGTIAVPPVLLLGQLFIFENRTTDRAAIRLLQADDAGLQLTVSQDPIEVDGNIVVPPLIDGRKLIVLSDRGQILVLDIDPTSTKNKVSVIASEVASEKKPTMTWGVSEGNQLWMSNYRFTRWDIQISKGKTVRQWIVDDGDQFVGPPLKFGDLIVHRRVVRGNRGVRISAVSADKGEPVWLTDVGVPISWLASPKEGSFDAITSGAAQFSFEASQTQINQSELKPEGSNPGVLYQDPQVLENGVVVLHNISTDNKLALYDPKAASNSLKIVTANLGSGKPTAPPAVVGDNIALGLNNGQLVVINPTNGAQVGTPFQAPVEPGRAHVWQQPVYASDSRTIFAADNRRKLYRLAVGENLRSMTEADIEGTVVGGLAVQGKQVAAVVSNQAEESLFLFDGTTLKKTGSTTLDGRWQAGPFSLGADGLLVQTDRKLQAFGADAKKRWEIDFPRLRLSGKPSVGPGGLSLAATNGAAWLINPASGEVLGQVAAGQPLSTTPLAVAGGMLLGTDEGSVLLMRMSKPAGSAEGTQ